MRFFRNNGLASIIVSGVFLFALFIASHTFALHDNPNSPVQLYPQYGSTSIPQATRDKYPCPIKQGGTGAKNAQGRGFWVGVNADIPATPTLVGDQTGNGKKFNCHATNQGEWWIPATQRNCDTTANTTDYTCPGYTACNVGQPSQTRTCYKAAQCTGPESIQQTRECCSVTDYDVVWGSCNEGAANITQSAPAVPQPTRSEVRTKKNNPARNCVDTTFTPRAENCCSHEVASCTSYSVCSTTYIDTNGTTVTGKKSRSCTRYQCNNNTLAIVSNTPANPNPATNEQVCEVCDDTAPPYGAALSTGCTSQGKKYIQYSVPASTSQCSFRVDNPTSDQSKYHEVVTTRACDQCAEPSESDNGQYSCLTSSKCADPTKAANGTYSCPATPDNPNGGRCDPTKTVADNKIRYYMCTVLPGLQCYSPQGEHYAVRWCQVCSDAELMTAWSACVLPPNPQPASDNLYHGKQTRSVKTEDPLKALNCAAPPTSYATERECTKTASEVTIVSPGTPIEPQVNFPEGIKDQTLRYDGDDWVASGLLINNASAIGIGTATPASLLHIYGGLQQTNNAFYGTDLSLDATGIKKTIGGTDYFGHRWALWSTAGDTSYGIGSFVIKDQSIGESGVLRLIIDKDGNVGIPGNVQIGNGIVLYGSGDASIHYAGGGTALAAVTFKSAQSATAAPLRNSIEAEGSGTTGDLKAGDIIKINSETRMITQVTGVGGNQNKLAVLDRPLSADFTGATLYTGVESESLLKVLGPYENERFVVDGYGRLTIGSTTPDTPAGTLRILSTASNRDATLVMQGAGTGDVWLWVAGGSGTDARPNDLILKTKTYSNSKGTWESEAEIGYLNTAGLTLQGTTKGITLKNDDGTDSATIGRDGNNDLNLGAAHVIKLTATTALEFKAANISFFKDDTGKQTLHIDTWGNVGIGTTDTKSARFAIAESADKQTNGLFVYVQNGKTILSTSAFSASSDSQSAKKRLEALQKLSSAGDSTVAEKNRINGLKAFVKKSDVITLQTNFIQGEIFGGSNNQAKFSPDIGAYTAPRCTNQGSVGEENSCVDAPLRLVMAFFGKDSAKADKPDYKGKLCPCASDMAHTSDPNNSVDFGAYGGFPPNGTTRGRGCNQKSFKLDFGDNTKGLRQENSSNLSYFGTFGTLTAYSELSSAGQERLNALKDGTICYDLWKDLQYWYWDGSDKANDRNRKYSWIYHVDVYEKQQ